jgi:hypothetical protein
VQTTEKRNLFEKIAKLDGDMSLEHGEEQVGFNEDFLLAMQDEDALDTYHERDHASLRELTDLHAAMVKYATERDLIGRSDA